MRARGLFLAIPLLAMLPEGLFSNVLYLPRVHNDSGFVTGVAVSSVEDHSLEVNLILTDPMGNEVRRKSFQLPPMGQIVGTLKDLIGSPDGLARLASRRIERRP